MITNQNSTEKNHETTTYPQAPVQLRMCLECERPFLSWSAGNRVCDRCKQLARA